MHYNIQRDDSPDGNSRAISANPTSTSSQDGAVMVPLHISPPGRWRMALYTTFAISYAIGSIMMGVHYGNSAASVGFAFTTVILLLYIVLVRHQPETIQQCTFLARTRQGMVCFTLLGLLFLSVSLYLLALGISKHQAWTAESYFCAFISFLMGAKWSMLCGLRVRYFRKVATQMMERGGSVVAGIPMVATPPPPLCAADTQQCPMGFGAAAQQEKQNLLSPL